MSIDCNPRVLMQDLILYLDVANTKSFPLLGGDKWYDLSGNGNHFQMFGFVPNTPNYFILDPPSLDYFASYSEFIFPVSDVSVEMWCKPVTNATPYAFWSFTSNGGMSIYQSVHNQDNLTLTGPTGVNILTDQAIVDDGWKHIVRTSSRSSLDPLIAGKESLYINGNLAHTALSSPNVNYTASGVLLIGQKPNALGNLDPTSSFSGYISIFKVYNKTLSANEVKKNFNAIRGRYVL